MEGKSKLGRVIGKGRTGCGLKLNTEMLVS
jgi:hypothetical protein